MSKWLDMDRAELREEGGFIRIECRECWRVFDSDGPLLCESCRLHVSTVGITYEDEHGDQEELDTEDLLNRFSETDEPAFIIEHGSIEYREEDEFLQRKFNEAE